AAGKPVDTSQGGRTGYLVEYDDTKRIFEDPRKCPRSNTSVASLVEWRCRRHEWLADAPLESNMVRRKIFLGVLSPTLCLAVASCQGRSKAKTAHFDVAANLVGAGATFPTPLYQKWDEEFTKAFPKIEVEYAPLGSGKGVEKFMREEVDFAASDGAL